MTLEIRSARAEEFPVVADLCVAAYEPFLAGDHHYVAELRDVAARAAGAELLVAADPAGRGRGVGAALLRRVLDESRRRGKAGVVCSSLAEMRAAHRIYERLGFRRAPERDWSPAAGVELLAFAISL